MDHNLLVSELQALIVESKRRNPEVRDAGEAALEILRPGTQPRDVLAARADTLLAPVTLGCKTKNAKIVGISIAALQRLVALGGVPLSSLPDVLTTLGSVAGQAVEIQLKILQTLLSILTYCKDMHGDVLGTAFLLCFKLQDSRVSVVSSTAAATLRQAIMVVFDRVSVETDGPTTTLELPTTPPSQVEVTPAALDTYAILSDLCLLTAPQASSGLSLWPSAEKEKPRMLKLSSLQRTFGLELIESILSGYEGVAKQHPELLFLLQHKLHPLIIRLQTEKPTFAVALRICRLIFVLIRHYSDKMSVEVEIYITSLIRMGVGEAADDERKPKPETKKDPKRDNVAPWLHVLALEILRGVSGDAVVLRNIWTQYDKAGGPKLFAKIVSAFGHLINEKPALLGVASQMYGLDVPPTAYANANSGYLDMGIGIVASAASVGVNAVGTMMGSGQGGGLGYHSTMKQRLIEQHDKTEAPAVPETYIYLLAVQSLDAIAESIVAGAADENTRDAAKGMAEAAWPALLASLSYIISTDLSDQLFAEVLTALQVFTVACGNIHLDTPRDAFLNTLARYAVPPAVVSAMQSYIDAPTQRGGSTVTEMGLTALGVGPTGPPSLSERNLACLRSLISVAQQLASTLGPGWHDVLEVLQNANYLLTTTRPNKTPSRRQPSISAVPQPNGSGGRASIDLPRPDLLQNLNSETIQGAVNSLFERSRELNDSAFAVFITALCRLSAEMIGMDPEKKLLSPIAETPSQVIASPVAASPNSMGSPNMSLASPPPEGRRRASGIQISPSIKSGERSFGLAKLRSVATINLARMVKSESNTAWTAVMHHLLGVARHGSAPSTIRMQASDTLGELLLASLRAEHNARIQRQVFDVLGSQVDVHPISNTVATDYDVRAAGYQTLNQILQSWGHNLEVGWSTIFGMLNSVCKHPSSEGAKSSTHRGNANLVRIAFPSLTLICTDFLSSLDASAMRLCIACLGHFGQQQDDVNITLAAVGLLWSVSDAVQGDSKELWLYLLTELLRLASDPRLEVRSSSMQTLFRCLELYGGGLSQELWEEVFNKVVFPLLEDMRGDESQVLALTSVGAIFGTFMSQISALPSSQVIYSRLLDRLKKSFISEPRPCSTAALKVLDRVLPEVKHDSPFLVPTWDAFVLMGEALLSSGEPYTQENLVALVRVASKLHDLLEWNDERVKQLSSILRSVVEYSRSNDYRPDTDVMSPLQQAIAELVSKSKHFGPSVVLTDLSEFASLAYVGETGSKVTYVALSKFAMPTIADVFARVSSNVALYNTGTVESVLGAYALPIKLKYDCPPASKYGNDPPLWRTAMTTFVRVLDLVMPVLDTDAVEPERYAAIWAQVMDVFAGVLLAEGGDEATSDADDEFVIPILDRIRAAVHPRWGDARVPEHMASLHAETLRKASVLYHYDVRATGGTTAPAVSENREATRYWALNQLVVCCSKQENETEDDGRVAASFVPAALRRFEETLRGFLNDAKLRGQMPFAKVREEEVLYVLRHLVTMTLWPGSTKPTAGSAVSAAICASPRAHLFRYYPLLLELALAPKAPSMWILPREHGQLFGLEMDDDAGASANARDGSDLIQVSAQALARRALELVGGELGLGAGTAEPATGTGTASPV